MAGKKTTLVSSQETEAAYLAPRNSAVVVPSRYYEAKDGTVNVEPEILHPDIENKINNKFEEKFKLNSVFSIQEANERELIESIKKKLEAARKKPDRLMEKAHAQMENLRST